MALAAGQHQVYGCPMQVNGEAVKSFRILRGRSMRDLAMAAGIDVAHLSRVESGLKGATDETIQNLAVELGVSPGSISYPDPPATAETIRRVLALLDPELAASSR
jgi:transcriptional regulator with XRE-family HTH domain